MMSLKQSLSLEIIRTNKGGAKLCLDGYMYLKKRSYNNWIRWQCNQQRTAGCKGALTTDDTFKNPRSFVDHNHPADRTGVEVTKLRSTMKAVAKQSRCRPHQILTEALLAASDEVRANIGKIQTCKRDLQRQRRSCRPRDFLPVFSARIKEEPPSVDSEASSLSVARQKLDSLLNKNMRIRMTDGRTLVGLFLCTDRDCNVILGSAQEFLKSSDTFSQGEPRVLGLAMIPGHHVVSIEVEADSLDDEQGFGANH